MRPSHQHHEAQGMVPGATAVPLRSLRPPTPCCPCGASSAPCSGAQTGVLGEQAGTPGRAVPGSRVTSCPGVPKPPHHHALGAGLLGKPRGLRGVPPEPGGAGEPPGSSAPSLATRPLTSTVPFSLLSAGHADDLQRGQGAGAALQAEGEGGGGSPGPLGAGASGTVPLAGCCWPGPSLRAGFVPGRTTWCGRKPRA